MLRVGMKGVESMDEDFRRGRAEAVGNISGISRQFARQHEGKYKFRVGVKNLRE